MPLIFGKQASRKYIDLIHEASSRFANWDPSKLIKAGDYGTVERKTGDFLKDGNIYDNDNMAELATKYPLVKYEPTDEYKINSSYTKGCTFDIGPHADIAGLELTCRSQWQFSKKRGALLVIHQPRLTAVPDSLLAEAINLPDLRGKSLVVQSYSCRAYVMYLSSKNKETVKFALRMSLPAGSAIVTGGGFEVGWWNDGASGTLQAGHSPKELYTPLYYLRSVQKRTGRRDGEPIGESWEDTEVPWNDLDDDGSEIVMSDDAEESDSDSDSDSDSESA